MFQFTAKFLQKPTTTAMPDEPTGYPYITLRTGAYTPGLDADHGTGVISSSATQRLPTLPRGLRSCTSESPTSDCPASLRRRSRSQE